MMTASRSQRTKTRIARERAETVPCPFCAATPGDHCISPSGQMLAPHADRVRLAKRALRKEQVP